MTAPGGPPASGLARFSWAMFDWANQPFFTVVTTFIFAPYFVAVVVGDAVRGQALWGYAQAAAGLALAALSPLFGAIADAAGRHKLWILFFQLLAILGCLGLWWAEPGRPDLIFWVLAAVAVATVGAEFSIVFNNALLPRLVPAERMGRLSGFGWGMGYLGGLVSLFAVLAISRPELMGITPPPGQALLGLARDRFEAERLVGPASALWLAVFVLPMFLFTPDAPRKAGSTWRAAAQGAATLVATLRRLAHYRNPALFLLAFMTYNNGLAAVIAFGGIYAAGIFGWGTTELGIFGIILTIFAAAGAFGGGWLDDRLGSRATVLAAVAGVTIASLGIMSIGRDSALFFVALAPRAADAALFASAQERLFLVFAILLGIGMGPMQAASRTLVARLAPAGMAGEFFGLFALSGRATAFLAPLLIAVATDALSSQRAGLAVVLVFLVLGFFLMLPVREEQARPLA